MLSFNCPECGKPLKVPDRNAGRRGRCRHCNNVVTAPITASPEEPFAIPRSANLHIDTDRRPLAQVVDQSVHTQDGSFVPISLEFTGKVGEYFKIWIVNVFLTILTLGIYSAWAKVRKNRYFYGNTLLQNVPFDYLADPIKILIGRSIVFGIFVLYTTAVSFMPISGLFFLLLFALVLPFVVVKALTFKRRNTSYRNIRFDFRGTYGQAFGVFIGTSILVVLTFGLAYPLFIHRRSKFIVEHSRYGTTSFTYSAKVGSFYHVYLMAVGIGIVGTVVLIVISIPIIMYTAVQTQDGPGMATAVGQTIMNLLTGLLIYLPVISYTKTAVTNLVWSNTSLGGRRLMSTLKTTRIMWLYLSNAIAIFASLGLLIPWASIRMVRYRVANVKLLAADDLHSFVAGEQEKVAATGEELTDFFDFDVGL